MSKSLRLLIVEDSEDDALLLMKEVERCGYKLTSERVETAGDMKAALNRQEWDAIVSDYQMPHFDAPSALQVLRDTEEDIPFIIVSGTIGEDIAVLAMKAGAHDYLMKDNLARLVPVLQREIKEAETRRQGSVAEKALAESAVQWRSTFNAMSEAICLLDKDHKITRCNQAVMDLTGKVENELIGHRCWEAMHNTLEPLEGCPHIRMLETKKRETMTLSHGERILDIAVDPVLDENGDITGSVHIVSDVTERARAKAELKTRSHDLRERYKELNCLFGLNQLAGNRALNLRELVQQAVELLPPAWRHPEITCARITIDEMDLHAGKCAGECKDTMEKMNEDIIVDGKTVGGINVGYSEERETADEGPFFKEERDLINAFAARMGAIIEQREAESSLKESESRFKSIFDTATDGILLADVENKTFVLANRSMCRMMGYSLEELQKLVVKDIHPEEGLPYVAEQFEKQRRGEIELAVDMPMKRKDGSIFYADINASPVELSDKTCLMGIFRDTTERKQAEERLQHVNAQLVEALEEIRHTQEQVVQQERLRALGQMASGIAHDFNNELQPIVGFTELLLSKPENLKDQEKARRYLTTIQTAANDAAAVVGRLREFYRRREDSDYFAPIDLNSLVEHVISLARPRWKDQALAEGRKITIKRELGKPPVVPGNAEQLRQVLLNLVINAVDALPNGGTVTIRTYMEKEHAIVAVSDTGIGMDEKTRRYCFEPFFSAKGEAGTGMGLAVAYGIIERHKGSIDVISEEGQGSTFTIHLPVTEIPKTDVSIGSDTVLAKALRILLIDDEDVIREVIGEYLSIDGHTIETAEDGEKGLEVFKNGKFDLVITDRSMPGMSGDEVAVAVKEIAPDVPVLMLTGFGELLIAQGEKPDGVDMVTGKPVKIQDLRESVAEAIRKVRRRVHNKKEKKMDRKRILVVDDNESILLLMKEYLEGMDMKAILASDAEEGLRIAREDKPDAILLDIMMPDMSGGEMAAELKKDPETADIRIVFLTGLAAREDTSRRPPGDYRILSKYLSPKEMQEKLREFLS